MTAPTLYDPSPSGATAINSGGSLAPTAPAGTQAGDILLLLIGLESVLNAANLTAIQTTAGFTQLAGSPVATGSGGGQTRMYAFWKRATSSSPTMPTWANFSDYQVAICLGIRGCPTTGNPWDVFAWGGDPANDINLAYDGVTTTEADTRVIYAGVVLGSTAAGTLTGTNCANFDPVWKLNVNSSGKDGGLMVYSGTVHSPGPSGTATGNTGGVFQSDTWLTMALKPLDEPGVVNTEVSGYRYGSNAASAVYAGTVKVWP
jgi:hypothetical protein